MKQRVEYVCPVCGASGMDEFVVIENAPAHVGVLWPDRDAAVGCPKGDIRLAFCDECGFVYNTTFDSAKMVYEEGYDNALHFSPVFQEYATRLANDLIARHGLRDRDIIDVGCGKGDFLKLICELGNNRGAGFDPDAPTESEGDVEFVRDLYAPKHADRPADLITCRQVFEHIEDPAAFLESLRQTIGDRATPVFFEVPDLRNIALGNSPWEIIYEHCSYFGAEALAEVFRRAGFNVDEVLPLYNGLYLGIHARPGEASEPARDADSVGELAGIVERFSGVFERQVEEWNRTLESFYRDGKTVVAWGAGARGTSFANILDGGRYIEYLVDINPRKNGRYTPGTGQEIVAPGRLADIDPDVVIVMNPVYLDEIRTTCESIGLNADVRSV